MSPVATLSGAGPDEILPRLRVAGALLLRDPATSLEGFLALSDRLSDRLLSHGLAPGQFRVTGGKWSRLRPDGPDSLFNAAAAGDQAELVLHSDYSYQMPEPPHLLWFYCLQPSRGGGATLVCDGQALFEALAPADQARFLASPLIYERRQPRAAWQDHYWASSEAELRRYLQEQGQDFELLPDGTLLTRFQTSALRYRDGRYAFTNNFLGFAQTQLQNPQARGRVSFADGHPIDAGLVARIASRAQALTRAIEWQRGDIGLVDNSRMLHGRSARLADDGRELCLRMSWVGALAPEALPDRSLAQTQQPLSQLALRAGSSGSAVNSGSDFGFCYHFGA